MAAVVSGSFRPHISYKLRGCRRKLAVIGAYASIVVGARFANDQPILRYSAGATPSREGCCEILAARRSPIVARNSVETIDGLAPLARQALAGAFRRSASAIFRYFNVNVHAPQPRSRKAKINRIIE